MEELMGAYIQSERNDPRSVYYERSLIRPKIPIGKLLICLMLTLLASAAGFGITWVLSEHLLLSVLVSVAVFLAVCVVCAKRILIMAVKIYQAVAPERVRKRCRYEPSCSCYMILAVEKYGTLRGAKKGFQRWRRCRPPNGGYDMP